ncbi:aspartate--tRNA ligase [Candidatus Berkelbacteria bacterium CG_4_9_14_3_um_filter_39_23]|uniref:Aspartate--tRNA(Asp/Asn) ligase n=2 Tax=Candidatus Berkelbacteria TaxID=1618330 RepID=A0A2M7CII4_9BACT|nr:aspartate--tRNA ligase [Candidatus Berkelbacteria bacterium]OIP06156.1 MAG: hypothetical protein AUK14_00080 [Candidatus Berkelbacteria bacterium CG2_30_39_44]PIR28121.1 MAG: aspartate--tRNA ligase [Candidatus Berkelbacteria bacterium CG11_big_fil_rev_8_21_14_0_20_40_23]PIV25462.1 MAG: aspartate--tRNA ligase [Candidatus Berkelbacteria bacterium CG03_land_8_20_14_0_80_40_36]PIX30417.1 MAG: aspartate--tRNA ligase [Candidatus Berkelbacteria bacterium CG_4_8_14_3_um_filter_39_27]PIZ28917.1 MAG:
MKINIAESSKKINQKIILQGWVSNLRIHKSVIFIDLRDRSAIIQAVIEETNPSFLIAKNLNPEDVISLEGVVIDRPNKLVNKDLITGKVEFKIHKITILSKSAELPFEISDTSKVNEETRLEYRYLDLRSKRMQKNLEMRHKIIHFIRNYLNDLGFLEVETPILTKSTPEGARDFLVPSRIDQGNFYALPQSPQQYKQLLMVAGIEKYFQIARCFRDEDSRGDRQPEFTQLDMEMSFIEQEDILQISEKLFTDLIKKILPDFTITKKPFFRLTYNESMKKYGTDKPDLRNNKNNPKELAFGFVVDFPMFEKDKNGQWTSAHHPFTMMKKEHLKYLNTGELNKIFANSYDFILNGYEIASGSIRINQPEIQKKVFNVLGFNNEQVIKKFGHMIEAFKFGAPPHGGIAPGIDRFVMLIQNEPNIREVIAFPKTGEGRDPMMKSPSQTDSTQLKELGIKIKQ